MPRSVPVVFVRWRWRWCRRTLADLVHRRARLRDLGCRPTASCDSTRRWSTPARTSPHPFRRTRAAIAAPGEELRHLGREFRPIYTPTEAGLDRFVDLAKPGLIGGLRRRRRATRGTGAASSPSSSMPRAMPSATSRCGTTAGRRLDHLRRLRALRRQVDRAGYVPAALAGAPPGSRSRCWVSGGARTALSGVIRPVRRKDAARLNGAVGAAAWRAQSTAQPRAQLRRVDVDDEADEDERDAGRLHRAAIPEEKRAAGESGDRDQQRERRDQRRRVAVQQRVPVPKPKRVAP